MSRIDELAELIADGRLDAAGVEELARLLEDPAQRQAAFVMWLGERVAKRRAERTGQNVSGPEENTFRESRKEIRRGHNSDEARKQHRPAPEAQSRRR